MFGNQFGADGCKYLAAHDILRAAANHYIPRRPRAPAGRRQRTFPTHPAASRVHSALSAPRRTGLLLLLLAACSPDGPPHGVIYGEAFLAPGLGEEEVNLSGMAVHLLDEPVVEEPVERLDSVLSNVCVQRDRYMAQTLKDTVGLGAAARDTFRVRAADAYGRAWRARNRILGGLVRWSGATDGRATFVIDSVPPGDYRVWADTVIDGDHLSWLSQLEVEAGDSIRLNLSSGNLDMNPFRCVPT